MELKTVTASLRTELDKIKAEKAAATQAIDQANAKVQADKLASAKEIKDLKEKSGKEINELKTVTASLRTELYKIKGDKAAAIQATNQANAEAQANKTASANEINKLKTATASLRTELDKIKAESPVASGFFSIHDGHELRAANAILRKAECARSQKLLRSPDQRAIGGVG